MKNVHLAHCSAITVSFIVPFISLVSLIIQYRWNYFCWSFFLLFFPPLLCGKKSGFFHVKKGQLYMWHVPENVDAAFWGDERSWRMFIINIINFLLELYFQPIPGMFQGYCFYGQLSPITRELLEWRRKIDGMWEPISNSYLLISSFWKLIYLFMQPKPVLFTVHASFTSVTSETKSTLDFRRIISFLLLFEQLINKADHDKYFHGK